MPDPIHRYRSTHVLPKNSRTRALALATFVLLAFISTACSSDAPSSEPHKLILAIDRTGSTAQVQTWQAEVATQTQTALETAIRDGVDQAELVGIGSNTDQVATVASADLTDIEGNTSDKREEARQRLITDVASAAAQVAAVPVDTHGTDVFAAFQQTASLCAAPEVTNCSVLLLSDLEDHRVLALSSPDDVVEELGHLMPDLSGITVDVSGLGASSADAETVHKVKTAWELLLSEAGATDVRIARSL